MADRTIEIIVDVADRTQGGLNGLAQSLQKLDALVQKTQAKLKSFASAKYQATINLIDRVTPQGSKINSVLKNLTGKVYNVTTQLIDNASAGIRRLEASVMKIAGKAHTITMNLKDNVSSKMSGIANGALMGAGSMMAGIGVAGGIGYGVANAIQSQMDFEKQMSAVKAIMSGSTSSDAELAAQMEKLTAAAERAGATTKFTAKESADALYYMAMAGWDANKSEAALPAVLNLAAAGNTDLGRTSDIVTDSMTGLGLKAGEQVKNASGRYVESADHFADIMAALVTNANTDISMAGETMKYSAATVGAMYSGGTAEDRMRGAEDLALITGLMANAGIKASQAGTSQRSMFTRLSALNRNAEFARSSLGVDFVDQQTGEVRRLRDVLTDLRKTFNEGASPEAMIDLAERLGGGEKIHADTRRKLSSFLESVQAKGGKMSGADKMMMGAMLAGQEAMSGWLAALTASEEDFNKIADAIDNCDGAAQRMADIQLDNLAGDITLLGSAWDAFQRNLVKGEASAGLREFTQGLADLVTKANNLFKDGIQIGDFGAIVVEAINKLKNKFLEFDGIGSLLAGGALVMGLRKIANVARSVYQQIQTLSRLGIGERIGTAGTAGGAGTAGTRGAGGALGGTTSVGAMTVHASVVNVNGRMGGGTGTGGGRPMGGKGTPTGAPSRGIPPATGGSPRTGNQRYVDDYYSRKGAILQGRNDTRVNDYYARRESILGQTEQAAARRATLGGIGSAGLVAGVFGALDVYSARSQGENLRSEAANVIAQEQQIYRELQDNGADQELLNQQAQRIQDAQDTQTRVIRESAANERRAAAGAAGAVTGAMAGAALGSLVPIIGTAVGGMIGGVIGQFAGEKLADIYTADQNAKEDAKAAQATAAVPAPSVSSFRQADEMATTEYKNSELYLNPEQYAQDKAAKEAAQVETVLRGNAEGMRRRNYIDQAEMHGAEMPGYDAVKRHSIYNGRAADDSEVRQVNFQYAQDMARGESLAKERDEYNKKHQMQFGGTSLAGTPQFDPASLYDTPEEKEHARQALQMYDQVQADAVRQENLVESIRQAPPAEIKSNVLGGVKSNVVQSEANKQSIEMFSGIGDFFKNLFGGNSAKTEPPAENKPAITPKLPTIDATNPNFLKDFQAPKVEPKTETAKTETAKGTGILAALDNLLFSKAAASEITPQTNLELSTPYNSPVKPRVERDLIEAGDLPDFMTKPLSELELPNIGEKLSEMFSNIELPNVGEKLSEMFSDIEPPNFEDWFNFDFELPNLSEKFSAMFSEIEPPDLSGLFSEIELPELGIADRFVEEFEAASAAFNEFTSMASATFDGLTGAIQGGVESAKSTITSAFSDAAAQVQAVWGAVPAFFDGVFSGLGGVAAAAGAAIMSGLTSVIGSIIGAWQSAASTISSIISSIASAASNVAGMIPSFGGGGPAKAEGGFITSPQHILAGEAGTEVIIPLSTSRRARAMDLLQKTITIMGGDASAISGDKVTENVLPPEISTQSLPATAEPAALSEPAMMNLDATLGAGTMAAEIPQDFGGAGIGSELSGSLSADNGATPTSSGGGGNNSFQVDVGGLGGITFTIENADNPQELMQFINENIQSIADNIASSIAGKLSDVFQNMPTR